ncbi:MAG: response regulator [Rhodospirillaceae bacterium TMED63]|nr:MAG: response regulator [Rhodospirillaceae bacterium TMED63]
MEPMDGIALVNSIRHSASSSVKYVPIIMLTGHSDLQRVQEARDSGVNEFMAKPVAAKDSLKRLEVIVGHPRPFIENDSYFGPDRRRKNQGPLQGTQDRREGSPPAAADEDELSPEEAPGELGVGTMSNAAIP